MADSVQVTSAHVTEKHLIRIISKAITNGLVNWGFYMAIGVLLVTAASSLFTDTDSTDSPEGRSGLEIKIDNLTGCHYLTSDRGGLTPRLHEDGSHLGCNTY